MAVGHGRLALRCERAGAACRRFRHGSIEQSPRTPRPLASRAGTGTRVRRTAGVPGYCQRYRQVGVIVAAARAGAANATRGDRLLPTALRGCLRRGRGRGGIAPITSFGTAMSRCLGGGCSACYSCSGYPGTFLRGGSRRRRRRGEGCRLAQIQVEALPLERLHLLEHAQQESRLCRVWLLQTRRQRRLRRARVAPY